MSDDKKQSTQINIAEHQRNVGQDYYEYHLPESLKLLMAVCPDSELDRIAMDNQRMFYYRFGLDANEIIRAKLIALKNKYSLTDLELRSLIRSSQLKCEHSQVMAIPDRVSPTLGAILIFFISLEFLYLFLILSQATSANSWSLFLAAGTILGIWIGFVHIVKKFMVSPWRILKKSQILKSLPRMRFIDSLLLRPFSIDDLIK